VRIAIVSTPFVAVPPPTYGGTELVVHALARALVRGGHDVSVFATGDSKVPGLRALFTKPVWPPDPYVELLHCRFAAHEIARARFDVAHLHCPAALAFAGDLGVPAVYTVHHERDHRLSRFYTLTPGAVRVAISRRQAELGAVRAEFVVHHGLDLDLYPPALAARPGMYAFFLGRLSWCKGPELAIEAARRAGLEMVVAGRTHDDVEPEGAAWREHLLAPALRQSHVRWLPQVDLETKRRLFAEARALLVPLRWEEPFGLVMIEAMLAGCPVIAFRRGSAPEVIEPGVTGFLVRDVGEMATALGDAERVDRVACAARARERFSAERMARDYLAVYRAAIARRAAGPGVEEAWRKLAQ
jgi:glycosyltransferase involved in cell wall biosynthesis